MKRTAEDTGRVVALITERSAHWTSQGYVGARLYERLASDCELPENLDGKVIAEFENKQPGALAQQRKHGRGPSISAPCTELRDLSPRIRTSCTCATALSSGVLCSQAQDTHKSHRFAELMAMSAAPAREFETADKLGPKSLCPREDQDFGRSKKGPLPWTLPYIGRSAPAQSRLPRTLIRSVGASSPTV